MALNVWNKLKNIFDDNQIPAEKAYSKIDFLAGIREIQQRSDTPDITQNIAASLSHHITKDTVPASQAKDILDEIFAAEIKVNGASNSEHFIEKADINLGTENAFALIYMASNEAFPLRMQNAQYLCDDLVKHGVKISITPPQIIGKPKDSNDEGPNHA